MSLLERLRTGDTDDREEASNDPFEQFRFLHPITAGGELESDVNAPPLGTDLRHRGEPSSEADLQRVKRRLTAAQDRRRTASLLVMLAHLRGVDFNEAAEILGTSSAQLLRWIRGEQTVPARKFTQIEALAQMLRHLHRVLEPDATPLWLHTAVPALGGRTPAESLKRSKYSDVERLARSYTEPPTYS